MDEHSGCSKLNQKETTKQQTCICNAKQESKTRLLVKFDSRLGFFTPPKRVIVTVLDKSYMHYENLNMIYITMQCKRQHKFIS
jgi:hypothetical protein